MLQLIRLPGQRALQVLFCTDMPSQNAPPLRGAGLVHVRERFWMPRPQRTLQGDQSVHNDHPPLTGVRERGQRGEMKRIKQLLVWVTPQPTLQGVEPNAPRQRARWPTFSLGFHHRWHKIRYEVWGTTNELSGRLVRQRLQVLLLCLRTPEWLTDELIR